MEVIEGGLYSLAIFIFGREALKCPEVQQSSNTDTLARCSMLRAWLRGGRGAEVSPLSLCDIKTQILRAEALRPSVIPWGRPPPTSVPSSPQPCLPSGTPHGSQSWAQAEGTGTKGATSALWWLPGS